MCPLAKHNTYGELLELIKNIEPYEGKEVLEGPTPADPALEA